MQRCSLSEPVVSGLPISSRPRRRSLASTEAPRNRLGKCDDLIEGAMMQSHARDRPAVVPCNDRGASHRLAGEDPFLPDWAMSYWGANLSRLRQIKSQYDPNNIFRHAQSVQPIQSASSR